MKGVINIKNKYLKCSMWYRIRLINPTDSLAERINKQDKKLLLLWIILVLIFLWKQMNVN